jgi:FkbM family methyltransferase
MTIRLKPLSSILIKFLPPRNGQIYRICKRYVDNYNGENNSDIKTNGEYYAMQKFLPRITVMFDVGTNTGEWTSLAIKLNPTLNVHCFEPSFETYKHLLSKNFPPNVVCNNIGLSSAKQELPLYQVNKNSRMNSIYQRSGLDDRHKMTQEGMEMVSLETLDRYCSHRNIKEIGYLKLDIEGHEFEALKGASELLSRGAIKIIHFEYGGCNIDARVFLKDIFELFIDLPYRFYKIYPNHLKHIQLYSQALENFQYQNWLILNNEVSA